MKKEINICEYCGKESRDYGVEIGWVHIDFYALVITNGRDNKGYSNMYKKSIFYLSIKKENSEVELDFCCIDHFAKWLEK